MVHHFKIKVLERTGIIVTFPIVCGVRHGPYSWNINKVSGNFAYNSSSFITKQTTFCYVTSPFLCVLSACPSRAKIPVRTRAWAVLIRVSINVCCIGVWTLSNNFNIFYYYNQKLTRTHIPTLFFGILDILGMINVSPPPMEVVLVLLLRNITSLACCMSSAILLSSRLWGAP